MFRRQADALRDLIDNALSHSPPGEIVDVTIHALPAALEVADHGRGIPLSLRPHVFDPFSRGANRRGGAGAGHRGGNRRHSPRDRHRR
jgi:signal transduction histidine kinase